MADRSIGIMAMLVAAGLPLAGCQSFMPRDETPVVPTRLTAAPDPGPSSQRRDARGFPLIGAYPTAAATQVSNEEVAATKARFSAAAQRGTGSTAATYQRDVSDLQAIAASQQSQAPASPPGDAASSRAQ